WASLLYRIRAEERILAQDAGWAAYARAVRFRLLPGLWGVTTSLPTRCRYATLLWSCKRPLPYSPRRPTLFQPMHAGIDVAGSIQGLRQRVEQTHPPMMLRSHSCQLAGWASGRNGQGKRQTQRHGLGELLMAYYQSPLVKHHHITVKEPVPFGDTGSNEIE